MRFSCNFLCIYSYLKIAGAANPTYLKENGDKAIVGVAFTLMTVGVLTIFNGLWNMSFGIHKVAGK